MYCYNAKVVTVDDRFSYAQAVAITGDTFGRIEGSLGRGH